MVLTEKSPLSGGFLHKILFIFNIFYIFVEKIDKSCYIGSLWQEREKDEIYFN